MKILITGIHGFVGSNLVGYLSQGRDNTIYGLDIVAPEKPGVAKTFSWDDLEAGNIPEVDAVIHLAGKAHDTKNKAAADVYFKVNTGLTQKIFDWFLSCKGTKKFVFFSTAKSAADRVEGVLTEDVVPAPVGPYGESKIKAEEYMIGRFAPAAAARPNRSFDDSDSAFPGKSVYILRPCMIHGPGNKGNLNLLYSVVSRGIPWPLGAFDNLRTFTSVENICYAVSGLLTNDIPSGIYNMGDDEPLSTNELITIICEALGKKSHIWKLGRGFMTGVARLGGVLHLPLNPDRLQKLTENYVSSNAKIKTALGVASMPVDARRGLRLTIASFSKAGKQ